MALSLQNHKATKASWGIGNGCSFALCHGRDAQIRSQFFSIPHPFIPTTIKHAATVPA
ncbi:MAG: hypothetical protein ACAF41_10875 [Leptolyngbya sp. BL-A-14]